MADKYANYKDLSASESEHSYRIDTRSTRTDVALIAPHAGKIEPGTSEICKSVAGDDLTYYLFEGCKSSGNVDLHISSARFDEPLGLSAAQSARLVVTFHGQKGDREFVNVGGLADELSGSMIAALNDAGFEASRHSDPMLQGRDANNICNRGSDRKGVQLEVSRALRDTLVTDRSAMARFSASVRSVLQTYQELRQAEEASKHDPSSK